MKQDINDLHLSDPQALKKLLLEGGERYEPKGGRPAQNGSNGLSAPTIGSEDSFKLICLADVDPEPVNWLWDGYLALGKLALVGGDPELGKSQISNDVAARLSREGAHWPIGARTPMGASIFICSEDGIADTVRPRCEAAGADLQLMHVLKSTFVRNGKRKIFNLADDLDTLGNAIKQVGNARFICIDAITSYMGRIDSHRTTDVRGVLEPVADFAEMHGVCILGVTHPPKASQGNALRSFAGSFAFVAAPRLAHFVTKDPDGGDRTLFLPVKNNLGPKARGIGYRIATKDISFNIRAPYIQWDDAPVDYSADQALAANSAAAKDGGIEAAKEFLTELLADGPVESTVGEDAAEKRGIKDRTLDRARKKLGIKAVRDGFGPGGKWMWKYQ
jgi:AAA domain